MELLCRRRCVHIVGALVGALVIGGAIVVVVVWRLQCCSPSPPQKVHGMHFNGEELAAISSHLDMWAKDQIQKEPSLVAARLQYSVDALFSQMMNLEEDPGFFKIGGDIGGNCSCNKTKTHACLDCYRWIGAINVWGLSQTLLLLKPLLHNNTRSRWEVWYHYVMAMIAPAMEKESPYAPDIFEANPSLSGAFVDDQMWFVIGYTQLASLRLRARANITSDDVRSAMHWLSYATQLYNAALEWGSRQILWGNSERGNTLLPSAVVGADPSARTLHTDYKCMVWFSLTNCPNFSKECQNAPAVSALDTNCAYAFGVIPPLKLALTCENLAAVLEQQPELIRPSDFDVYCSETLRKHHVQVAQVRLARLQKRNDAVKEFYTYTNFAQVYATVVGTVLGASYGTIDPLTDQPTQVNEAAVLQRVHAIWHDRIKQVLAGTLAEVGALGDVIENSKDSRSFKAISLLLYMEMGHLHMELSRHALNIQGRGKPAMLIQGLRDRLFDPVTFPAAQLFAHDLTITNNKDIPVQPYMLEKKTIPSVISYANKRALYFSNYWLGKKSIHPVQKRSADALLDEAQVQSTAETTVQPNKGHWWDEGYSCTATQVGGIALLLSSLLSVQQNTTRVGSITVV